MRIPPLTEHGSGFVLFLIVFIVYLHVGDIKLISVLQDKAAQLVDKFGSLMKIAVAEKADEQRNNVVFDIFPKEHGFKEVFPGEQKTKQL